MYVCGSSNTPDFYYWKTTDIGEVMDRCNKIPMGIECYRCGYPFSEAMVSDLCNGKGHLPCYTPKWLLRLYIETQRKRFPKGW
jgi:hypothetical protein